MLFIAMLCDVMFFVGAEKYKKKIKGKTAAKKVGGTGWKKAAAVE